MTTVIAPDRLALPPPLRLDLVDDERAVGWIDHDEIAFRGFTDETEAAHAAWVAYRTIARRLARTRGTRPVPIDVEPLALGRVGDDEVILAGPRRIARLLRPGAESGSGDDSLGFALGVHEPTSDLEMRELADLAYRTLRKSGVRWALWKRNPALPALPLAEPNVDPTADVLTRRNADRRDRHEPARRRRWSLPGFAPRPTPAMLRW